MKSRKTRNSEVLFLTLLLAIITGLISSNSTFERFSLERIRSPVDMLPHTSPTTGLGGSDVPLPLPETETASVPSLVRDTPSVVSNAETSTVQADNVEPDIKSETSAKVLGKSLELRYAPASGPDLVQPIRINGDEPRQGPTRLERKAARGSHPDKAVAFRNLQMKDENGRIPLDGLQQARDQMARMRSSQRERAGADGGATETERSAGVIPWQWLGPGNIGGRIRSIVIHPTDPSKVWVGSVSGGIWKTTNAGVSWSPVNDFMANLAVSTMVMDPTNPNIMYAGTGESFAATQLEGEDIAPDGIRGDGVFKSIDGGITWTQLASTRAADPAVCGAGGFACAWSYVNRLAMSPDGTTILAATFDGIHRSTDGGATWVRAPSFGGNIQEVDFDPANSSKAIAGRAGATRYSTDGGATWIAATFTPALNPIVFPGPSGRIELAYAPSNPLIVYASVDQSNGVAPNQTQGEVFQSGDGGATFTLINASNPGNTFLGGQGGYDNIIWVNPLDPTFVIVGGVNMYRSTDSGVNWTAIASGQCGSAHSDHHMIVAATGFNNTTNKQVYFSNDGGMYIANDVSTVSIGAGPQPNTCLPTPNGWTELNNNLGVTQFYAGTGNSAGVITGGTQDNGTLRYSGDPQAWTTVSGGDGGFVAADPVDNNFFYDEYINLTIKRSTDGGASSSFIYCNPVPTNPNGTVCTGTGITDALNGANFIAPFILDPNDPNRMLAGGLSLWRSNDIKNTDPAQNNGLPTWTAIEPPIPPRPPLPGQPANPAPPISAIAVSETNSDLIVVGHNDGQIYITFDGTGTNPPPTQQCPPGFSPCWSRIDNATTPSRFVTRLAIDETRSPNWIYATFGGFSDGNVFRTTDLGVTWTDVTGTGVTSLPSVPVRSLVINPNRADLLYVGTEVGVFTSEDAGATWQLPQDGPANVAVDELFWLDGSLVAVTHGRGLFKTGEPLVIIGGGNGTTCNAPPPNCQCYGQWECPCSWNINRVPNSTDDVGISCMTITGQFATARNVRINTRLSLNNGVSLLATGDVANYGTIESNATQGNSIQVNRDFYNQSGLVNLYSLSVQRDAHNGGIIALATTFGAGRHLSMGPGSSLTAAQQVSVTGNLSNQGAMDAGTLATGESGTRSYSGGGLWKFTNFVNSGGTISLGSDVAFDITNVFNIGVLDVGTRTLTNRGGQFASDFQSSGLMPGTGKLKFAPTSGNATYSGNGPVVEIASGNVEYRSGGTSAGLVVGNGATFSMNTPGTLTVNGDITVDGTLSNPGNTPNLIFNGGTFTNNGTVGNVFFLNFNLSGLPKAQTIVGAGSWMPRNVQIGNSTSPTTVTLQNDVAFSSFQFVTALGSAFNVANRTFTLTGPMPNTFAGRITGTGLVRMQPASGTPTLGVPFSGGALIIDPALEVASGTVRAGSVIVGGPVTVNSGATLSLFGSFPVRANGNFTNNGTVNAVSDTPTLGFTGNTFTNNGILTGNVLVNMFSNAGTPVLQNLGGTGSWSGSPRLFIDSLSTTTLLNDFTYNGGNLFVEGRLNTGAFTLSVPCTTQWQGAGDVIGSIRRTNLAACPGAAFAFGNPFTTIQFTAGTPPTEITVNTALAPPVGFPNAARRTYLITPTGGSGYTATLRLHYLDSELNGNAESTLQLWRDNGTNWTPQGATNRSLTNNWVEYAGVSEFSPWTLAGSAGPMPSPTPTQTPTPTPTPSPTPSPGATPLNTRGDYDGDNKTDLTVWRPTAFAPNLSAFYTVRSTDASFFGIQFGNSGDVAIAGDFDGDNKTDFGVSRFTSVDGVDLIYLESSTNTAKFPVWGNSGDVFISGDYDGDKKTDMMAWRPSDGTWYIVNSSGANGGFSFITHGQNGDKPYAMDTDADGKSNLVYFRPSSGDWVIRNNDGSTTTTNFGLSTDIPVPADYDGDNKEDIAVFRDGLWIVLKSSNGQVEFTPFGAAGDVPVPGDYDGDNLYDRAVYRPVDAVNGPGIWYLLRSTAGPVAEQFGAETDTPMPKAYIP